MTRWITEAGEIVTPRELDVLRNMVRGLTNKENGIALKISPRTVEIHRSRVLAKLGARNDIHATIIAIEEGMVDFRIEPRMMTQETTAKYCGVCVATLLRTCPVQPTELSNGVRRYDKHAIDRWLDALANGSPASTIDPMAALDDWNPDASKRRKTVAAS